MIGVRVAGRKLDEPVMPLQWFEDSVAYCDTCKELETAVHLYEKPTIVGTAWDGTWFMAVPCGNHAAIVAGRTSLVGPYGVDFPRIESGGKQR